MIIFNNLGHTFIEGEDNSEPIIWVDSSDTSTYTLGATALGNELVTNGDFSDGSAGWSLNSLDESNGGSDILNNSGVKLTCGNVGNNSRLSNTWATGIIEGKTYLLSYNIIENNGCIDFAFYQKRNDGVNTYLNVPNTVGFHQVEIVGANLVYTVVNNRSTGSDITIDNISVKEVTEAKDVTSLLNKGTLGGVMSLNGSVKFANNGFESWSNNDYITRDLGQPFLPDNSFTIFTTVDIADISNINEKFCMSLRGDEPNRIQNQWRNLKGYTYWVESNGIFSEKDYPQSIGTVITFALSYDVNENKVIVMFIDGTDAIGLQGLNFNNILNAELNLLALNPNIYGSSMLANNPLHEFRLYDRAMSFEQMQTLQTELNNKYTP
jgi:hypothetical protein